MSKHAKDFKVWPVVVLLILFFGGWLVFLNWMAHAGY